MAATHRLSASEQMALSLACEAFSDATHRYHAEPGFSPPSRPPRVDASVRFSVSGKQFEMPVVIATNPASASSAGIRLASAAAGPKSGRPVMLVTQHVTARLAQSLIAKGIPFLDTAGNAWLDEPEATIMIVGRSKPALAQSDTRSRSTTPKGLRVTFALATQPGLVQQPYRTIAQASGVALNTVNLAVDDLIARGLVVHKGNRRVLANPRRMIDEWASLYPARLRPKLMAQRFTSGVGVDWWQGAHLSGLEARLGGECAADLLTHEIKPASVTVYARTAATLALKKTARLRADPQGEVEILESFWPETAERNWDVPPGVVHPLLVYADLIATGDSRHHAVAQTVYDRFLANTGSQGAG
ncbi:conserved hypothetical protein [Paraburkholderia unamae]|uniref:type IV toxin-antitoxin system AbiEi family antitoxin n=1 Tax=Paraburkholderia unamae TaxID=219649 RepID=UPI001CAEB4E1|nr:type IV toxin-antitoxin system AbiEi family antitoxin [Paraburkholderia unamae]CAG9274868.1 conserved hypothetical protein [Paraburkholderia unamae]